jgi:hypothetical protein
MAVSVVTLWLVYFLVFLVVAIILSLPRLYVANRTLIVVLFSAIAAILTVTFIPVDMSTDVAWMSYNSLLSIGYMLVIILVIILAVSFSNPWHHHRKGGKMTDGTVDVSLTCDEDGSNCHTDKATIRGGRGDRVKITYR